MEDSGQPDRFDQLRHAMVEGDIVRRGVSDPRVLAAMFHIPRHRFVAEEYWNQAYEDRPLPIGEGQTISQPYIVAVTLAALGLQGWETVLEVGTGSGYQTAILAELARRVYSIERHELLVRSAQAVLAGLGYTNIEITFGDGSLGWPEHAPFDAIVVSAAAPQIPAPLFAQLREGGCMVIPVGPPDAQDLQLVRKQAGKATIASLNACRFVPLIGDEGYQEG